MKPPSLRLPEKELPGVIHGYSLANIPFLHWLDRFYVLPERLLLGPRIERIPIDRPIFIVGPYRSGTTILQEIVASHPEVGYFWYLTNVFGHSPVLSYHTTSRLINLGLLDRAPIAPVHNPAIPAHTFSPFECESIWLPTGRSLWDACDDMRLGSDFSQPAFERELRRLIRSHLYVSRAGRFLNKNPINSLRLAYLHKLFPDALFINIVRDPLETVISHYRTAARVEKAFSRDKHTRHIFRQHLYIDMLSHRIRTHDQPDPQSLNREHPLLGIAAQWTAMQRAIQNATAADPSIPLLDLRYEDLVRQPAQTLAQIWDFTGLSGEAADQVTAQYTDCLSPRPPVDLTDEELRWLPRLCEIVAPLGKKLGYG